jgi:DinB superfamily
MLRMDTLETVALDFEARLKIAEQLRTIGEAAAARRPAPGKWSAKETIGHLIDSAANNHQRFIRMQMQNHLELPGYDGDAWVRIEQYQDRPWRDLVSLWEAYNTHLVHVIRCVDPNTLKNTWRSPEGVVDLEFVIRDYVVHMQHHLDQIDIP